VQTKKGIGAILVVGVVAVLLLVTVGIGYFVNKVKEDKTLGFKTYKQITVKPQTKSYSQLGLSSGDDIANINADFGTLDFNGIDSSLNEVSINISGK
jgi:hypothetical protein